MSAAALNVMELVDRKVQIQRELHQVEEKVERMPQSTEDFFTRDDRKELYRQTIQQEQILRDQAEIKASLKEHARTQQDAIDAHEKRLRTLEDSRLELTTQIQMSWRWIVLLSAIGGGLVNFLIKLIWK